MAARGGHNRSGSDLRRVALPRRNTKGPLDAANEAMPSPSPSSSPSSSPALSSAPITLTTPTTSSTRAVPTTSSTRAGPTTSTASRFRPASTPAIQTNLPPSFGPGGMQPSTLLSPDSILSYDTPLTPSPRLPSPSGRIPRTNTSLSRPRLDLSPLLRPALYHTIPTAGTPPPYLHRPGPDTPIQALLDKGYFRQAADKAAQLLLSPDLSPFDLPSVLDLFHTRLACLVLISHPDIAAKEARPLLDILAREAGSYSNPPSRAASADRLGNPPRERVNPLTLVPWDLRLLLERLKTVLSNDARRGVMNLYSLASECRAHAARAAKNGDDQAKEMWSTRLWDLGIRVASALVDMGEFETAARHLDTMTPTDDAQRPDERERSQMVTRKTLLYLRMGNLDAAARHLSASAEGTSHDQDILQALLLMAQADYSSASTLLEAIVAKKPTDELAQHNLAVSLVYSGNVTRASKIFEGLVASPSQRREATEEGEERDEAKADGPTTFPALLFNLATIYELRTERARERKVGLVERVVARGAQVGYERRDADFKL